MLAPASMVQYYANPCGIVDHQVEFNSPITFDHNDIIAMHDIV